MFLNLNKFLHPKHFIETFAMLMVSFSKIDKSTISLQVLYHGEILIDNNLLMKLSPKTEI